MSPSMSTNTGRIVCVYNLSDLQIYKLHVVGLYRFLIEETAIACMAKRMKG